MTTHDTPSMPGRNDYRTSMNELHFSNDAKARMTARLIDAAAKEHPLDSGSAPAHRRRSRTKPSTACHEMPAGPPRR